MHRRNGALVQFPSIASYFWMQYARVTLAPERSLGKKAQPAVCTQRTRRMNNSMQFYRRAGCRNMSQQSINVPQTTAQFLVVIVLFK